MIAAIRQWLACRAGRHDWVRWPIPPGAIHFGSRNVYQCQGCGTMRVIEPDMPSRAVMHVMMDQHKRNVTGDGYRPEQRAGEGI